MNPPLRFRLLSALIFTTYWFLLFAVIVVAVFRLLPWPRARQAWLTVACAVFHYHFAGPAGVLPIIVLGALTYAAALSRRRGVCLAAMIACGAALAFYKYVYFLIGAAVAPLSASAAAALAARAASVMPGAPPLGVSFFTFEFVHYLFEVRRGEEPIRNPLRFVLFAIFFPSLVAGPVKRYAQFLPSLDRASAGGDAGRDLAEGLARVGLGFFKKVCIADQLTLYVDAARPAYATEGLFMRWVFIAAVAFRILMDFSGYSDIAIGCARLLGIRLPENFHRPYSARSLQDFWQRWHISLSTWIRDYIYIPLGGGRHGPVRKGLNAFTAFALCGLWHGAAWHYVAWGLYHGAGLAVCTTYRRWPVVGAGVARIFTKEPAAAWALTLVYAWIGWLVFFYPIREAAGLARLAFGL